MGVSPVTCVRLGLEPPGRLAEAFEFVCGGDVCSTLSGNEGFELFQHRARQVLTLRRDEGFSPKQILASATIFEAPAIPGDSSRIFAIDAVRVAPEICGFEPNVQTMLLATSVALLATGGDADQGDAPACVIMAVDPRDTRTQRRLRELGAIRILRPPPSALTVLAQFRGWRFSREAVQCWWITAETAANAAKAILDGLLDGLASRQDRATGRGRVMTVKKAIPWLETARELLGEIVSNPELLGWVVPPSETPVPLAGGLAEARRLSAAGKADAG